eukprot:gene50352-62574_t
MRAVSLRGGPLHPACSLCFARATLDAMPHYPPTPRPRPQQDDGG